MKKRFLSSLILLLSLSLGSCELDDRVFVNNSSSISNNTSSSSSNDDSSSSDSSNVIDNKVIEINKSSEESSVSTIEQAISKVIDSVVVINSYASREYGSGAGVIIGKETDKDFYYVITCHHVIEGANRFEVILSDGTNVEGTLVGGDPTSDIAVLEIPGSDLTIASFVNDSDALRLGQTAIAIGNPLGTLGNSVSCGIISSVSRDITLSSGQTLELIQTDAAINSGNSGGGLFDSNGNLMGIVNAKYSASGVEGLGFAIPANLASSIAESLLTYGYVEGRFSLGATISDGYYYRGWSQTSVVYISNVEDNSSSDGLLQENDIVTGFSINYKDEAKEDISISNVTKASQINEALNEATLAIGDKVIFNVTRNNESKTIEVELVQYIYKI